MTESVLLFQRQVHRSVLPNGLVVLAAENATADIISARIFVRVGSLWERREQAGLSHLLGGVMTRGTDRFSSQEIAEQVESVGASLSVNAGSDYFLLSLKTVSADFPDILNLAGQLLRSPTFPEAELELERRLTLQGIRSQQEQPFAVAMEKLRHLLYQNHPYALTSLGTEATVAQLSRNDLQAHHQTYFRPDNIVVSLVGRLVPSEAIALVADVLGDWQAPTTALPTLTLPPITAQPGSALTPQDTQQSIVMLGYPAPSVRSERKNHVTSEPEAYSALKLLNTYLGNGLSSRLFVELREKRGLAYEVSAMYPTRLASSYFAAYIGTAPENTAIALDGLQQEIDRLCTTLLSPEELQTAKNKLLGQYALGKQTNSQIAQSLGWYEVLGLGIEFDTQFQEAIAAVTVESAQAAARHYFTTPCISLVGPAEAIEKAQSIKID